MFHPVIHSKFDSAAQLVFYFWFLGWTSWWNSYQTFQAVYDWNFFLVCNLVEHVEKTILQFAGFDILSIQNISFCPGRQFLGPREPGGGILTRSRPNWITGPGLKSGSAGKSGSLTWSRKRSFKMAVTELGIIYSQNYHFGLVYDISISWHGGKEL